MNGVAAETWEIPGSEIPVFFLIYTARGGRISPSRRWSMFPGPIGGDQVTWTAGPEVCEGPSKDSVPRGLNARLIIKQPHASLYLNLS